METQQTTTQSVKLNDYQRFKCLLEYFVAYLEYCNSKQREGKKLSHLTLYRGFDTYLKEDVDNGALQKSGQGWNGDKIQSHIKEWETYGNYNIYISANAQQYYAKSAYLNWKDTSINIAAEWDTNKEHIISLTREVKFFKINPKTKKEYVYKTDIKERKTCDDLGLFKEESPNNTLKDFFDEYLKQYESYLQNKQKQDIMNSHMEELNTIYKIVEGKKKNIILQGAPGVGKTYSTTALAVAICKGKKYIQGKTSKEIKEEYDKLKKEGRIAFCTFHQSMDYEDFVEGLKPSVDNGQVSYNIEDGIFKQICSNATIGNTFNEIYNNFVDNLGESTISLITPKGASFSVSVNSKGNLTLHTGGKQDSGTLTKERIRDTYLGHKYSWNGYYQGVINYLSQQYHLPIPAPISNSQANYVLIIDEINRGNISKIFGELITLLETDKRIGEDNEIRVKLPYSSKNNDAEDFGVPSNLYIIGTMNTTDRSTGVLDYALRRRFAFYTLKAKAELITNDKAKAVFGNVEKFIKDYKQGDEELDDLMVGHSYFMGTDENTIKLNIQYGVIPLLKEYIKDGILSISSEEQQAYFKAWENLETYNKDNSQNTQTSANDDDSTSADGQ